MLLLNKDDFKKYTGLPYGNTASEDAFDAIVRNVEWTYAEQVLNQNMIDLLKTSNQGPELEAFYQDYIKPWYANACKLYIVKNNNVSVTNAGVRTANTQTSNQSNDGQLNVMQVNLEKQVLLLRDRLINRYNEANYVFDGIAYPPVPKMKAVYNAAWNGYTYYNGNCGWGWYGASGALFNSVIDRLVDSAPFQIIGVGNPTDY